MIELQTFHQLSAVDGQPPQEELMSSLSVERLPDGGATIVQIIPGQQTIFQTLPVGVYERSPQN